MREPQIGKQEPWVLGWAPHPGTSRLGLSELSAITEHPLHGTLVLDLSHHAHPVSPSPASSPDISASHLFFRSQHSSGNTLAVQWLGPHSPACCGERSKKKGITSISLRGFTEVTHVQCSAPTRCLRRPVDDYGSGN